MPNPGKKEDKNEFMKRCVSMVMDEGKEQDQAVAICMSKWEKKDLEMPPILNIDFDKDDQLVFCGGEVKDLGDGKIGGYLLQFSSPNDPDLTKDFFSKDSIIDVASNNLPVFYAHGRDSKMGKRIIGRANTRTDEVGVWAETQLNLRDEYEKAVLAMAKAGKLGYSSGALPHLVEREPMGNGVNLIKTWVIGEASLTPTPAEPRNTVMSLKSLSTSEMAALPNLDDIKPKEIKMENEDIKAVVAAALAERDAADKAEAEKAIALKSAEDAGYKKAVDELTAKKLIKGAPSVVKDLSSDPDGVGSFKAWLRTGQENSGLIRPDSSWTKTAFNVTDGATGGFLVPDVLYNGIIAKRDLASWVRQAPVQRFTTTSDHIIVPVEATKATAFIGTNEAAAYNENEPTLNQVDIILYKYTKEIQMTEEFVSDQAGNFDGWISDVIARAVAVTENTLYTTGGGTGAPQGIKTGATAMTTAFSSATAPTALDLLRLVSQQPGQYNVPSECGFLMRNVTKWLFKSIASLPFPFLTNATSPDFAGYPAYVSDDMALIGTTSATGSVIFANFNMYGVAEKPGILVQRNPYLYMATGRVALFANIFRGGACLQPEAIIQNLNA
jgi:HK97 family phage major capsid protein